MNLPNHIANVWKILFVLWFFALLATTILSEMIPNLK